MPHALIAGAGVAGLATALALSKAGFEVSIFEREPALKEFGAGLQLSPNATRVLASLGVLDEVAAWATAPSSIRVLRGRDDAELSRLDLRDAAKRWGSPYLVIHRADLQAALLGIANRDSRTKIRLGHVLAGLVPEGDEIMVGVKRGALSLSEKGDLLIGADGLRSKTRERLGLGDADAAIFTGRIAFRATLPAAALATSSSPPVVTLRLGARAHLVQYPLRDGREINLVAVIESGWRGAPPSDPWDGEADRETLDRAFSDWSRAARALIAAPESWRAWPLFTRPPIATYTTGRVALVGDAAHPMVPFLAQGAAQAIEDAGALGRRLAQTQDIPAALAAYSRERTPRASRVQAEALSQARIYHLSGPLALARDLTMRTLGPERLLKRYDWLYGA